MRGGLNNQIRNIIKEIRVYQWIKNILVFVPLVLSHSVTDLTSLGESFLAFISFSFCASGIYVINDFIDLKSDRAHPTKKYRPLAAGDMSPVFCLTLLPVLFVVAFAIALLLPNDFLILLVLYVITTILYSLLFKPLIIIDVLILASLYTIRVFAGAIAIDVPLTFWILAFSLFFFFSLALLKRTSELITIKEINQTRIVGRGYQTQDTNMLMIFGVACGYTSILVLALYINDINILSSYTHPEWLWILVPALLYWVSRIWLLANRGLISEDPVLFAVKDRLSYLVGLIMSLGLYFAI